MTEKWKDEVESIIEKSNLDVLTRAFREKLKSAEVESPPEEWENVFRNIFRRIAYIFSMVECMARAFRMGQVWQKHKEELLRTGEEHGA